jgi:hypothetical protein
MGLLDGNTGSAPVQNNNVATGVAAPKAEKGNAYSYQKKQREAQREGAKRLLAKPFAFDASDKAFLEGLAREPGARGASSVFGTPIFNKLFGDSPAVGAVVTLQQVFDKTYKGKAQMDSLMKKWKEKSGVDIDFNFNKEKPAQSTYTIKSIKA